VVVSAVVAEEKVKGGFDDLPCEPSALYNP